MSTVNVELPADLVSAARLNDGDVSREVARLIALELFHENKISLGRAAELCRTPLATFMEFVAAHGISPLRYTDAELEEDRRSLAELGL
jgi:predicted HTH domain antitoxin